MNKFYDTSALINSIDSVFTTGDQIFISSITIEELEHLKATNRANANHVLRQLQNNDFITVLYDERMAKPAKRRHFEITNDMKIIMSAVAIDDGELYFVTDDMAQYHFALCFIEQDHILSSGCRANRADIYTGYKEIVMTEDEMADFYSHLNENNYDLYTNEYIIIQNEDKEPVDAYCWDGEKMRAIKYLDYSSRHFGRVKPYKNDIYQRLAFDAVDQFDVVMLAGKPGSAKTYIALAALFSWLEKGLIDRIVVFCNPVVAKDAAKLGYYPGDVNMKLLQSSVGGILASKLGSATEVERLLADEQLVLIPAGDARGYETPANSGVYIMESQNLTSDLLRLLLQRVADGCKVIVDGDYKEQVDVAVYADDNGMTKMSEVFRGESCYGQVELKNIYRSKIANIADKMRD